MTPADAERAQPRPEDEPRLDEALGIRLSRDTSIYVVGAVISFGLALASVIVLTHFLSPAEFGELALLLVFAAFLTVFYNVGILQGTFMWVFGSAGEEEVEGEGEAKASAAGTKRRALGTGLVTTCLLAAVGTAVIVSFSPWVAGIVMGDSADSELIVIAAVSGAAGAIWRLVSNIMRMERKPRKFVVLNSVRPVLVVGCVIPLVASGGGVEGAILGTTIGSVAAVLVGLVATRHSYELAFDRFDAGMIVRRGRIMVPIIISIWIAQNVDIYALSWFAPEDEVGLYRLANRMGAFLDYFTAALFMAWTPLRGSSTFVAAVAQRGQDALGGRLLTYFVLAALLLLLLITVAADTLVRIAPPDYSEAAPLIPLMGAAFLTYGLLVAVYRLSSFPRKIVVYIGAAISSAIVFLVSALLFVPWLGAYGAALSVITGFTVGTAAMTYFSQRGPSPLMIEWGKLASALALGGACIAVARVLGPLAGEWRPVVELVALALYPIALLKLGIVSVEDRRAIRRVVSQILPKRKRGGEMEKRLRELSPDAVSALEAVVVRDRPARTVAEQLGTDPAETNVRLVGLLRQLGGQGESTAHDQHIGEYLFSDLPVAERDELARKLWSEEADPADFHALEQVVQELQRLPKRAWAEASLERWADGGRAAAVASRPEGSHVS
jgi:O-antigen/teichoic acid export membrane protein